LTQCEATDSSTYIESLARYQLFPSALFIMPATMYRYLGCVRGVSDEPHSMIHSNSLQCCVALFVEFELIKTSRPILSLWCVSKLAGVVQWSEFRPLNTCTWHVPPPNRVLCVQHLHLSLLISLARAHIFLILHSHGLTVLNSPVSEL
jgi:hypothetical protein